MRFQIELPRHLSALLTELAEEQFRSPRQQVEYLLAEAIKRALSERDQAREQHLEEVLHATE